MNKTSRKTGAFFSTSQINKPKTTTTENPNKKSNNWQTLYQAIKKTFSCFMDFGLDQIDTDD